ncbi:MAG: transposase [Chloroflexi bacterium]|nr:transposase [Chloroflexota bacterium]
MAQHKGWHSRGYLPHFDAPGIIQGITFRLYDALPARVIQALVHDKVTMNDSQRRTRIEEYLNAGYGACYLRDPRIASLVEKVFFYFDNECYRLLAWVIMPNHVHVLIELYEGFPMGQVLHSWKSYIALEANKILGRKGDFWFEDYFDRYIRDERHYFNVVRYIHENPVKAGLVEKAEDWEFSSAKLWSAGSLPA